MVIEITINYWAVATATIIQMILGFFWYNPLVFGKLWMKLANIDEKKIADAKQKSMAPTYITAIISAFIMNFILAHFIGYTQSTTLIQGIFTGFWLWLGFIATVMIGNVLWEGKPIQLYILNASHYLVTLLLTGGLLAVWQL